MYPTTQTGGFYPGGYPFMPTLTNYGGSTYTAPGGGTNQGQQLQQLTELLSKITSAPSNVPPDQLQQAYSQAMGAAGQAQGGQNQYAQQVQSQNLQRAGVPGLIGQYGDLSKQFQLWMADKGFASQFGNQSPSANLNPYQNPQLLAASQQGAQQLTQQNVADQSAVANMTTPNQPGTTVSPTQPQAETANPFLGSTQSVIDSTSNLPTPPSIVTSEMGTQLGAGTNMLNLINQLVGAEQGVAQNATTTDVASYQDRMNVLNTVANALGSALGTQQSQSQPGGVASIQSSLNNVKKDVSSGMTLKDLMSKYTTDQNMTADKILQIYNANSPYGAAKESPEELASTYGVSGGFGKATTKYQAKKLPNGTMANFDPSTGKYFDPNTGKEMNLTSDQVQAAQDNVDTANSMMQAYQQAGVLRFIPGSEHFIPGVATAQSKLFQSLGSLRRGAIGGRITQQEINWLTAKLFPGPFDTPQVMQAKVQALQDTLTKFISDPNAHINSDGNVSSGGSPTITIKNKKTGQTLTIPVSEKGKYGL